MSVGMFYSWGMQNIVPPLFWCWNVQWLMTNFTKTTLNFLWKCRHSDMTETSGCFWELVARCHHLPVLSVLYRAGSQSREQWHSPDSQPLGGAWRLFFNREGIESAACGHSLAINTLCVRFRGGCCVALLLVCVGLSAAGRVLALSDLV